MHFNCRFSLFITFAAVLFLLPGFSLANENGRRVALVIGNGAYTVAPALANPAGDAKAVAAAFRRLGFEVIDGYDLTIGEMRGKLAEFSAAIVDSNAALVYYAGHGVSVDEENYLLPTDLALKNPTDLDLNAISLTLILKQMKREERVNVVILDACRDNPFAATLARARTRGAIGERGLSRVDNDLAKGTLIAFASDPKSVALDGRPGENSPFAKALLNHLEDPGVSIDTVMNRVRTEVWTGTGNKQMPWVNTSIIGEFALNPHAAAAAATQVAALPPAEAPADAGPGRIIAVTPAAPVSPLAAVATVNQDRLAQENRMWDSAEKGNSADDYQTYLDAYPGGVYARMAKSRIARLQGAGGPTTAPDPASPDARAGENAAKRETGDAQSEQSLRLDPKKRKDVQARLQALDYDPGKISAAFTAKTRSAISDWQNAHGYAPTGWLGPAQYAALIAESEEPYLRKLQAAEPRKAPQQRAASRSLAPAEPRRQHPRAQPAHYSQRRQPAQSGGGGGGDGGAAFMGGLMGGAIGGIIGRRF